MGLRDGRTSGGVTKTFTWDVTPSTPAFLDDGSQYIYGVGLISQRSAGVHHYYLTDGLGSVIATTGVLLLSDYVR